MRAVRHHDLAAFRSRLERLLVGNEAAHCMILGVLGELDPASQPILIEVDDGGEASGAAVYTPPSALTLTAMPEAAVDEVAERLARDGDALPGVAGPVEVAERFARSWSRRHGLPARLHRRLRIHENRRVLPPTVPADGGVLRLAGPSDLPLVQAWAKAFGAESGGHAVDEKVKGRLLSGAFRFWETDRPVSMAACVGPTPTGVRMAYVFTPPELRGAGYASACVAALTDELLRGGRQACFLFTDLANPTSNKIYARVGYTPVCDVDEWRFG